MKNSLKLLFFMTILILAISFNACSKKEDVPAGEPDAATEKAVEEATAEETKVDGAAYGYAGSDPAEAAVYKYMAEEVSKNYGEAEIHIPTVTIVHEDLTQEDDILVYGDFWIENYNLEGDTLKCVSGGNYPGVMHLNKDYTVTAFDQVADGSDFASSARELFGEHYDDFMKVYGDSDAREELRKITILDYVNLNGISAAQYQDEGWDPVKLQ